MGVNSVCSARLGEVSLRADVLQPEQWLRSLSSRMPLRPRIRRRFAARSMPGSQERGVQIRLNWLLRQQNLPVFEIAGFAIGFMRAGAA